MKKINLKNKIHFNSLFIRIICTVTVGILCLITVLSVINISLSKEVFVDNFEESQDKIFRQIDYEFYEFYTDIANAMAVVASGNVVQEYITEEFADQEEERKDIIAMKKLIDETAFSQYPELNMVVLSTKGKSYIHNSSARMSMMASDIFQLDVSKEVVQNPRILASQYLESGITDLMKKDPVVIFAKAMVDQNSNTLKGIVYVTIKESEFQRIYSYFTSNTSEILVFNQNYKLLSSSNPIYFQKDKSERMKKIVKKMEEKEEKHMTEAFFGKVQSYQMQTLQNVNYKILGIINPDAAFSARYRIDIVLWVTAAITLMVAFIIFRIIRAQTKPIYELAETIGRVREGNLEEYVEVKGTDEVRELSRTYNKMIKEINHYVEKIYAIEKEKRTAEIHALQMQINPHYMYNTLASIKWLTWQQDVEKATKLIDAFISLLRNTISNTDEFITVEQEIENLKNYVLINQVRYGDNINVEFFVAVSCREYKLPKLILQPFVENAFFHGFPEGKRGNIQIFSKTDGEYIRFDIVDDGIGMNAEKLMSIQRKGSHKGEHFTGIGVNNVDDRIKMIYGVDYGINIISGENEGTTVTIKLPLRK